jgi:hypothetical protein
MHTDESSTCISYINITLIWLHNRSSRQVMYVLVCARHNHQLKYEKETCEAFMRRLKPNWQALLAPVHYAVLTVPTRKPTYFIERQLITYTNAVTKSWLSTVHSRYTTVVCPHRDVEDASLVTFDNHQINDTFSSHQKGAFWLVEWR